MGGRRVAYPEKDRTGDRGHQRGNGGADEPADQEAFQRCRRWEAQEGRRGVEDPDVEESHGGAGAHRHGPRQGGGSNSGLHRLRGLRRAAPGGASPTCAQWPQWWTARVQEENSADSRGLLRVKWLIWGWRGHRLPKPSSLFQSNFSHV